MLIDRFETIRLISERFLLFFFLSNGTQRFDSGEGKGKWWNVQLSPSSSYTSSSPMCLCVFSDYLLRRRRGNKKTRAVRAQRHAPIDESNDGSADGPKQEKKRAQNGSCKRTPRRRKKKETNQETELVVLIYDPEPVG